MDINHDRYYWHTYNLIDATLQNADRLHIKLEQLENAYKELALIDIAGHGMWRVAWENSNRTYGLQCIGDNQLLAMLILNGNCNCELKIMNENNTFKCTYPLLLGDITWKLY
jgi:hypothetical protein